MYFDVFFLLKIIFSSSSSLRSEPNRAHKIDRMRGEWKGQNFSWHFFHWIIFLCGLFLVMICSRGCRLLLRRFYFYLCSSSNVKFLWGERKISRYWENKMSVKCRTQDTLEYKAKSQNQSEWVYWIYFQLRWNLILEKIPLTFHFYYYFWLEI